MTSSREAILGRVRTALDLRRTEQAEATSAASTSEAPASGVSTSVASTPSDAVPSERINAPQPGVIPARGQGSASDRVATFIAEAERVNTDVVRVADRGLVAGAVRDYLVANDLPMQIKAQPHPDLQRIPWADQADLTVTEGVGHGDDAVGISAAIAGVAETGTLILTSGVQSPVTNNFLPDTHIVTLNASTIEGDYETTWESLRQRAMGDGAGKPVMPRTVNWITGPSRTADIEQSLLLGAHGPRRLLIVLIDGEEI